MMRVGGTLRARLAKVTQDDSGFTMLEIVVVMVILSIVLIIFTTGITQAFSAEGRVDTASRAEAQLVIAFQRLDKEVRYATAVSAPSTQSGDPVIEFLTPNLASTSASTCTEVRLHSGTLQQRTWVQTTGTPTANWQQLALGVIAGTPGVTAVPNAIWVMAPFAMIAPTATAQFQRVEIALSTTFGTNKNATTKQSDITFTALNTTSASTGTTTTTVCNEGRGVAW